MMQVSWFKYTPRQYGEGRRIFLMSPAAPPLPEEGLDRDAGRRPLLAGRRDAGDDGAGDGEDPLGVRFEIVARSAPARAAKDVSARYASSAPCQIAHVFKPTHDRKNVKGERIAAAAPHRPTNTSPAPLRPITACDGSLYLSHADARRAGAVRAGAAGGGRGDGAVRRHQRHRRRRVAVDPRAAPSTCAFAVARRDARSSASGSSTTPGSAGGQRRLRKSPIAWVLLVAAVANLRRPRAARRA